MQGRCLVRAHILLRTPGNAITVSARTICVTAKYASCFCCLTQQCCSRIDTTSNRHNVDAAYKQEAELHSLHDLLYESAAEHPGDVCYLLFCRVVLGYSLRTQQPCNHGPLGRGVAMDDGSTEDGTVFATRRHKELKALKDSEPPLHHHSLLVELGGRIHRYREFVVFHGELVYPYVPVTLPLPCPKLDDTVALCDRSESTILCCC